MWVEMWVWIWGCGWACWGVDGDVTTNKFMHSIHTFIWQESVFPVKFSKEHGESVSLVVKGAENL